MSAFDDAESMLRMAYRDFRALTGMGDAELFVDEIFGFHVQQAVEKGLKAWLCALVGQYPLTHDLERLLMLLESRGCDMETYRPLTEFSLFAVQARYEEGLLCTEEPLDRPAVVLAVQEFLEHVQTIIHLRKTQ